MINKNITKRQEEFNSLQKDTNKWYKYPTLKLVNWARAKGHTDSELAEVLGISLPTFIKSYPKEVKRG